MPYTLEQIQEDMLRGNLTPSQVSEYRVFLSALFSMKEEQHDRIRVTYPEVWLAIRGRVGSVKEADRMWEATEGGKQEARLVSEKRRIDKLIQALSTKWKAIEGEVRNQF